MRHHRRAWVSWENVDTSTIISGCKRTRQSFTGKRSSAYHLLKLGKAVYFRCIFGQICWISHANMINQMLWQKNEEKISGTWCWLLLAINHFIQPEWNDWMASLQSTYLSLPACILSMPSLRLTGAFHKAGWSWVFWGELLCRQPEGSFLSFLAWILLKSSLRWRDSPNCLPWL